MLIWWRIICQSVWMGLSHNRWTHFTQWYTSDRLIKSYNNVLQYSVETMYSSTFIEGHVSTFFQELGSKDWLGQIGSLVHFQSTLSSFSSQHWALPAGLKGSITSGLRSKIVTVVTEVVTTFLECNLYKINGKFHRHHVLPRSAVGGAFGLSPWSHRFYSNAH